MTRPGGARNPGEGSEPPLAPPTPPAAAAAPWTRSRVRNAPPAVAGRRRWPMRRSAAHDVSAPSVGCRGGARRPTSAPRSTSGRRASSRREFASASVAPPVETGATGALSERDSKKHNNQPQKRHLLGGFEGTLARGCAK